MGFFDFLNSEKREEKRKQKLAEKYGFANYEDYIKAQNKEKKKSETQTESEDEETSVYNTCNSISCHWDRSNN